jgi:phosphopantothenoylcysteine decarboxylase/phosphopantothenate--cysteine ligase
MFEEPAEWKPRHLSLAERASVFVIAPCTANVMAKLACGIADDLLTCTALAFGGPLIVAPAMNERMWDHPATRQNAATLQSRGVTVVDVDTGELACGAGRGRMASLDAIMAAVEAQGRKRTGGAK